MISVARVTFIVVLSPTRIVCGTMPIIEIINESVGEAIMEKFPLASEYVPLWVFFTWMVAPVTGALLASNICPLIVCWAWIRLTDRTRMRSRASFFIRQVCLVCV